MSQDELRTVRGAQAAERRVWETRPSGPEGRAGVGTLGRIETKGGGGKRLGSLDHLRLLIASLGVNVGLRAGRVWSVSAGRGKNCAW